MYNAPKQPKSGLVYVMKMIRDRNAKKGDRIPVKIGLSYANQGDSYNTIRRKIEKRRYEHDRRTPSSFHYYIFSCTNRVINDANILEYVLHSSLNKFRMSECEGREFFLLTVRQCDKVAKIINSVVKGEVQDYYEYVKSAKIHT